MFKLYVYNGSDKTCLFECISDKEEKIFTFAENRNLKVTDKPGFGLPSGLKKSKKYHTSFI